MAGQALRPFPPPALNVLTADDVMAVACKEGVDGFIKRNGISATSVSVSDLLEIAKKGERDYILMAAGLAGDGRGTGYGSVEGRANEFGYGHGNSFNYGDEYGIGISTGYGDVNVSGGYGNGYGGDGNGGCDGGYGGYGGCDGHGYGYVYGYGGGVYGEEP